MTALILPSRTDGGHTNRVQASSGGRWWSRKVCSHYSDHPGGALITASRAHDNDNKKWRYGCLDGLSIFLPTHPGLLFGGVAKFQQFQKWSFMCSCVSFAWHSVVTCSELKQPFLPEMNPLQGESSVSKPVHAAKARVGPLGAKNGAFAAKPSSHHAHVTLWMTPPTSPCRG